jgi:uncharacterized protein (DUF2062 family)
MENIQGTAAIIGIVNGVILLQSNRPAFVNFALAVALGVFFGFIGFFGLNLESGLILGLASSGFYKVAQVVGSRG